MVAELAAMVSGFEAMQSASEGVFLVGSGVDIPSIKPALEASTSLSVTAPEEPDMALARGAALASANASLGAPATVAMIPAADPGLGELAYSAVSDREADLEFVADLRERRSCKPLLAAAAALTIFVGGVVALAVALALDIRPHAEQRPSLSKHVVAPATLAPPPPSAVPSPVPAAPSEAPAPQSGPHSVPPQQAPPEPATSEQVPSERPRDHGGWGHRRLGRGILAP